MKEGNADAARRTFEDVLAADKKHLLALMALAKLQASGKNHQAAMELLERARQAHPAALAPRLELATYYLRAGEPKKAMPLVAEAEKLAPGHPEVLETLGSTQLALNQASAAIISFTTLARDRPTSVVARSGQGFAYMQLKKYKEAAAAFRQALALKPGSHEILVALTEALRNDRNYEDAARTARELTRRFPEGVAGRTLEGDVRYEQKKYAEALKLYEAAFASNSTGELAIRVYQAQARAGDPKGAIARLERFVRENPTGVPARAALGEAMLATGNHRAAAEHYQFLVERSSQDAFYLNNLAVAQHALKDPRALETAERAFKIAPANPIVLDTYGWLLVERDRARDAIPHLEKAASQLPDSGEVRYHLAAALAKTGEPGRAKRELQRALAPGKAFPGIEDAKALMARL
jgi:putative PEP-CTERM system TPR-repeat lipoprotein